jgi:hypothetical protein
MEKGKGWRSGFRVFRVHVDRGNLERLRRLFRDFADGSARVKGALRYREEWLEEWGNVLRMREEAGKRTMPKLPAALLPVRFVMPDGGARGDNGAPAVIDLRRNELRIPGYDIKIALRGSLVRALVEENSLNPRPDFVLQVTRRGFVRIIAQREVCSELALPLRIVTIDENSLYGHSAAHWYVSETRASMAGFEKLRPPNHGYGRQVASLFQSYADKPSGEAKQQLAEILPREVLETLTTERAEELAEAARAREVSKAWACWYSSTP